MANKRIKDLTEKSSFVSGDYFPIDNDNGTKKVNASKIMSPLSSAQTDATRALNMARNTSSFPTGDAYSSSSSYKVGNMVIYNNTLYRCKTPCSAASWSVNANNFEAISLASAITDLNNDFPKYPDMSNEIAIIGWQTSFSYTATQDCWALVGLDSGAASTAAIAKLNGAKIAQVYNVTTSCQVTSLIPLKKGDILSKEANSTTRGLYCIYGMRN